MFEKVKTHFKDHKVDYGLLVIYALVVGVAYEKLHCEVVKIQLKEVSTAVAQLGLTSAVIEQMWKNIMEG